MKIKTLLYCTKATKKNDYLIKNYLDEYVLVSKYLTNTKLALNGKIACECEVDTEELLTNTLLYKTKTLSFSELCERSCLDFDKFYEYLGNIKGYALHLSNVKERVMELSKCYTKKIEKIEKAPQNMMWVYVYVKENGKWEKRLLISVRPQWLCKILNGEKTIEVRRKVLKGMCE